MPPSSYTERGLHVEIYDTMTTTGWGEAGADVSFLRERFRNIEGPILELACGTGRAAIPLVEAGCEVHGLDASSAMLSIAEAKQRHLPDAVASRLFLTEGNMREFAFAIQFSGVYLTFRSFQNLLSPEDQESCLRCIRRHMLPGGILVINLFDPRYDLLLPGESKVAISSRIVTHPISRNRVRIEVLGRMNDVLSQCLTETWRFTELGPDDATVVRQEEEILRLRWTFRQEMRHLLRLCGFHVLEEYSDFQKSPPSYGKEQVWIAVKSDEPLYLRGS
jgi:ubiquinone/menaquinone biosynthesis C-methylase UbiE